MSPLKFLVVHATIYKTIRPEIEVKETRLVDLFQLKGSWQPLPAQSTRRNREVPAQEL